MPADVVNLRQARKRRDRLAAEAKAGENRIRFGRGKLERERSEKVSVIEARRLDGHKRITPERDDG